MVLVVYVGFEQIQWSGLVVLLTAFTTMEPSIFVYQIYVYKYSVYCLASIWLKFPTAQLR